MPSFRTIGAYKDYGFRYDDMLLEERIRKSRKLKEEENVKTRKKYGDVLRLIPYYPKTTTQDYICKKLNISRNHLFAVLSSLDAADCLIIQDERILSRLKEDLSNVY